MSSWRTSDPNEPLAAASDRIEGIPELGEGGHRTTASYVIAEADENAANTPEVKSTTEYHLRRFGKAPVSRGLTQGAGKGPDGAALAAAAAKSLKGKGVAPVDSFLNEGSFVFNPLNRRVPQPTPRKAKMRHISSSSNAVSSRAPSSQPPLFSATSAQESAKPAMRQESRLDQAALVPSPEQARQRQPRQPRRTRTLRSCRSPWSTAIFKKLSFSKTSSTCSSALRASTSRTPPPTIRRRVPPPSRRPVHHRSIPRCPAPRPRRSHPPPRHRLHGYLRFHRDRLRPRIWHRKPRTLLSYPRPAA